MIKIADKDIIINHIQPFFFRFLDDSSFEVLEKFFVNIDICARLIYAHDKVLLVA